MSESSSSCSPSAVHYSRSSSVNSAAGELRMPQLSVSSKDGNPSGNFCANMRVFYFILPVGKFLKSLTASGQSYFQQPFRVTDSARSPACLHPWCCRVCSEGSNAWISRWLLGCVATVVRWFSWGYSVQLFWQARPKSCRFKDNEALQC